MVVAVLALYVCCLFTKVVRRVVVCASSISNFNGDGNSDGDDDDDDDDFAVSVAVVDPDFTPLLLLTLK